MEETAYMIEYREHPGSYFPPPILTDLLSHSMEPWRDGSCVYKWINNLPVFQADSVCYLEVQCLLLLVQ